jgi:hypothetical protein
MDLSIAFGGGFARRELALATLARLGWAGGAVDVAVDADGCAAGGGGGEWWERLPALRELEEWVGSFPCTPVSERVRAGAASSQPAAPSKAAAQPLQSWQPSQPSAAALAAPLSVPALELYSRLTIRFSSVGALHAALRRPETGLFDLVAVRPAHGKALKVVMDLVREGRPLDFDLLSLDLVRQGRSGSGRDDSGEQVRLSSADMAQLRRARVFVELVYTQAAAEPGREARQAAVRAAGQLTQHVSRGGLHAHGRYCNLVLTGGACKAQYKTSPQRAIELGELFGLRTKDAQAAVTTGTQAVLERAEKRRRAAGWI